ncbi:hypothetical protein [Streptomyces sp. NBC_01477]|uniref:hypothetical protein n=1 Tax=Streptomyces sp. NBC_01477 TaxID=2976015 RepID=UPI002E37510B|nr:hypothetical protein [Streptomyces sp. NBC_01477]
MGMVTFVDETTSGETRDSWGLELAEERLSARELIRRRVFQEAAEFNARQPEAFHGLVRPTDAETTLNGYRLRTPRRLDPERQCALALDAFGRNGFLLLVADRQVEQLDDEVELPPGTEVVFLKLVPLVGG